MRAMHVARVLAQAMANRTHEPHVIWSIGWRTVVQPEGKDVPGGMEVETVYPETEEQEA